MGDFLPALGLALVVSWLGTPWVRRLAFRCGALDRPDERKVHSTEMPRLGGLAVYVGFLSGIAWLGVSSLPLIGLLVGVTLVVLLGAVDDVRGVSPRVKLAGQVAAALAVVPFGIHIDYITNPLNSDIIYLGFLSLPVTILWIVAVTNAINLIDGLDGLAGGVSFIAALTMAAVAWTQWRLFHISGQVDVLVLALVLAAAVLGFLRHNFHPARIFLGDSGSMMLGFTLAVISIMGFTKSVTAISVFIPLVVLGVPLLDTACAIVRRCYRHRPIFQPDREHLHHQLMALGLSHRQTVLVIYAVSALLGLSAVVINLITTDRALILLLILAVVVIVAADRVGVLGRSRRAVVSKKIDRRPTGM